MNPSLKLGLYVFTVVGTLVCGVLFSSTWRQLNPPEPARPSVAKASGKGSEASSEGLGTNKTTGAAFSALEATEGQEDSTNGVNEAASAMEDSTYEAAPATLEREAVPEVATALQVSGRGWSRLLFWGLLGLASLGGLGALIAYDVSQYAGSRATTSLFDDEGEGIPDTIDDQVEKAVGDGDFLEAVRLLREHLQERPRAVEAQIRIAEIYEKDLNNPLAAALEYEEILQKPMGLEKRGWTCIHLVNLYNRLNKTDQAIAWLQRLVAECPGTPAAHKARERLEAAGLEVPEPPAEFPAAEPPSEEPPSNLPPGFRPRS